MNFSRQQCRQFGALAGLLLGWIIMYAMDYRGLIPAAVFGITGCLLFAIGAEKLYDRYSNEKK